MFTQPNNQPPHSPSKRQRCQSFHAKNSGDQTHCQQPVPSRPKLTEISETVDLIVKHKTQGMSISLRQP